MLAESIVVDTISRTHLRTIQLLDGDAVSRLKGQFNAHHILM